MCRCAEAWPVSGGAARWRPLDDVSVSVPSSTAYGRILFICKKLDVHVPSRCRASGSPRKSDAGPRAPPPPPLRSATRCCRVPSATPSCAFIAATSRLSAAARVRSALRASAFAASSASSFSFSSSKRESLLRGRRAPLGRRRRAAATAAVGAGVRREQLLTERLRLVAAELHGDGDLANAPPPQQRVFLALASRAPPPPPPRSAAAPSTPPQAAAPPRAPRARRFARESASLSESPQPSQLRLDQLLVGAAVLDAAARRVEPTLA